MLYLLDTNIVLDLVRNPGGLVTGRIRTLGESRVCTSVIVAAELRYGAAMRKSARLTAQLKAVLATLPMLSLEAPADSRYGELRADFERTGRPIGGNELLIAAQALALGCTVVTTNESEFKRIRGLRLENWLR